MIVMCHPFQKGVFHKLVKQTIACFPLLVCRQFHLSVITKKNALFTPRKIGKKLGLDLSSKVRKNLVIGQFNH